MSLEQPYGGRRREDPLLITKILLSRLRVGVEQGDWKRAELEAMNLSRAFRTLHDRGHQPSPATPKTNGHAIIAPDFDEQITMAGAPLREKIRVKEATWDSAPYLWDSHKEAYRKNGYVYAKRVGSPTVGEEPESVEEPEEKPLRPKRPKKLREITMPVQLWNQQPETQRRFAEYKRVNGLVYAKERG